MSIDIVLRTRAVDFDSVVPFVFRPQDFSRRGPNLFLSLHGGFEQRILPRSIAV